MKRLILKISVGATCALAFGAIAASAASATATAYTVGSPTAIPAGESTGLAFDSLSNQVLSTKQFGAKLVLTATGAVECTECMIENQASPMGVVGSGKISYTGMTTNIPHCVVPEGKTTVHITIFHVTTHGFWIFKWTTSTPLVTIHIESEPGETCPIAGTYNVEGEEMTGTINGDVLTVNSTKDLTVNGEPATLKGEMTITAGVTGGTYHPIEFKES